MLVLQGGRINSGEAQTGQVEVHAHTAGPRGLCGLHANGVKLEPLVGGGSLQLANDNAVARRLCLGVEQRQIPSSSVAKALGIGRPGGAD